MVAVSALLTTAILALPFAGASSIHIKHVGHNHAARGALPDKWHHEADHPVHNLFRRGADDTEAFAPIGSPTWSAGFPTSSPDPNQLPKAWVDALNAATAAGKIPNVPQSTHTDAGPQYPAGTDPNSPQVCSGYYRGCRIPGDIWDAPDGYLATSFDDGPLPDQVTLNNFLAQNNEKTTYFLIGVYMLQHPDILQATIDQGHDIAVHTWTHPSMSSLSNLDILGELGWSVALFRASTGGKIPKYWRPPTGDMDMRVRAIAKEVFDLTAVIWNHDTEDWSLTSDHGTTPEWIHNNYTQWLALPKSPGMIVLEHVLSSASVQAFIDIYPSIKSSGWKTGSAIKLIGDGSAFQAGATGVINAPPASSSSSPLSSSSSTTTPAAAQSPSTSASVIKITATSSTAASPTASNNAAASVPARIFGSASVVALSYLLSLFL